MTKSVQIYSVLILEDDASFYRLIDKRLNDQRHEFQKVWAQSLSQALAQLKSETFDAVLTDLSVIDSDGFETVERLRSLCKKTPIIVLTSTEDEDIEDDVLAAGGQDYLVKSEISGKVLSRAIVHAVQRQQTLNRVHRLVRRLKASQVRMEDQSIQLKRKNAKLKRLYKTSTDIVDNVSHDLRTPLTVIKDYVAIVSQGMAGAINAEQKRLLDKVSVRADDLNHMVDDILDASKLESGLLNAWRRPNSVHDLISHASCLLKQRAAIRGTELIFKIPANVPEVYCDSEKAVRVITNLAINAIKFTPAGGKIAIWARSSLVEGEVTIGVTDEGPGIDQEKISQIFKRFEQLDDGVKSTVKGHGLGLNIAERLIRINLGRLHVESDVGKGSTFTFTMPIADPSEVFGRWLENRGSTDVPLSAIEISVDESVAPDDADDFDKYVNCLLRRDDILFRMDVRNWILVLPIHSKDMQKWEARASDDFNRFSRNRPRGTMPGYSRRLLKEWKPPFSKRKTLSEFDSLIREDFANTVELETAN